MSDHPKSKTQWHHIFAALLQELLTPVGITVETNLPMSSTPPEIDIVLIRQQHDQPWTEEQRAYLPDGIRDSLANHVVLELKLTETVNKEAIEQALMYDIGYHRDKAKHETVIIQSFLVSAKTPNKKTLTQYGYQATEQAGIYHSDNIFIESMPLLLLNELSDEAHNVFFKLFASHRKARVSAVQNLRQWWLAQLSWSLRYLIQGLIQHWLKGEILVETLTADKLREQGKLVKDLLIPLLNDKDMAEILLADNPYLEQIEQKGRDEGLKKGRDEGLEEGRHEGEKKAKAIAIKNIRQTLAIRFGAELGAYDQRLNPLKLSVLEQLNDLAFMVETIDKFEAELMARWETDSPVD